MNYGLGIKSFSVKAKIIFKFVKSLTGCTAGWWFGISTALASITLMVWLSLASKVASCVFSWENVYLKWLGTKRGSEYLNKEMRIQFFFFFFKLNKPQKCWTRQLLPVLSIQVRIRWCVLSAIGRKTRCPRQSPSFWFTIHHIWTCPFPSPVSCMNSFSHKLSKWNVLRLEHFFGGGGDISK